MAETPEIKTLIENIARELEDLWEALYIAHYAQWVRPSGQTRAEPGDPGTHETVSNGVIRQKGQVSDPVGSSVADEARLTLRHRLKATESELQRLYGEIRGIRSRLDSAVRPYR